MPRKTGLTVVRSFGMGHLILAGDAFLSNNIIMAIGIISHLDVPSLEV